RRVVAGVAVEGGVLATDLAGAALGAGDGAIPAHVLDLGLGALQRHHGAVFAPAGDRAVDDARVDLGDGLVVDAEALRDAGAHVDDEDVGELEEAAGERLAVVRLEVEEEAALTEPADDVEVVDAVEPAPRLG